MTKLATIRDQVLLNNGVSMPWLGFGVYLVQPGQEVEQAVTAALATGYRSIDTAALYANEEGVGKAIRASGIPRSEIFVTTKLWNDRHGYEVALRTFEESRKRLRLEYVDLYLIHWPATTKVLETWRAFEKLLADGRVRAIGVSNFLVHHLDEIAKAKGKSVAQVLIRWDLQHEIISIPKSIHAERIKENALVFDFELTSEEMSRIDGLKRGRRLGPDPDRFKS